MIKPESNKNLNTNSNSRLSVQVSLNGLSFLMQNDENKTVEFEKIINFESTLSPEEVLNEIQKEFSSNIELSKEIKELTIIHQNNLSTLVPRALFDKAQPENYLKFNSKIFSSDYVDFDELGSFDIINVYVPFANINNYFFERYGAFTFFHFSTRFVETILNDERFGNSKKMFVHLFNKEMSVFVSDGKNILLFNTFLFNTPEDFLYYTLFVAEQLELNPEEFELTLSGEINKEDDYFKLAYNYIRNVSFKNNSQSKLTKVE
ncbi:DUF3822 family protein [uncultured Planktosalinus sp.]|uniref:DUF3822 family protein n=1 Tax=uncultured Planktosalinus sp. TaxID=1810935 RepID=UPI0030DC2D59